jgi:hypothetical protein
MSNEPVVMYDSDEAAKIVTVTGWASRHGRFFGDGKHGEHLARYDGCTHRPCSRCGEPETRGWLVCKACREKEDRAKFLAMPEVPYDADMVVVPFGSDLYLFRDEEVECYADSLDPSPTEIKLVVCEPQLAHEIDPDEFYTDILPEDMSLDDVDPTLAKAFDTLNALIRERKAVLSWVPGKTRTTYRVPERSEEP